MGHFESISSENDEIFSQKMIEIMIKSYSLNSESLNKNLYKSHTLNDMFVSSNKLIQIFCRIILYRTDCNNLIDLILHKLLSINDETPKKIKKNPKKRSREEMSGNERQDMKRETKRFKASSPMNSSINVMAEGMMKECEYWWCNHLPLAI